LFLVRNSHSVVPRKGSAPPLEAHYAAIQIAMREVFSELGIAA
jgi:hypothetical protein